MPSTMHNNKIVLADGTVLIDLTSDTVDEGSVLAGITFHDKAGTPLTGTCAYDSDTSEDTAAAGEILVGKTVHARGAQITGTMPNRGGVSGNILNKSGGYIIPQGYHDGSGMITLTESDQEKLVPANIRQGVTILGVAGSMSGSEGVVAQAKTVDATFSQQQILPDTGSGFTHLSQVTVNAIKITYSDNSAGGKTVTIGAV